VTSACGALREVAQRTAEVWEEFAEKIAGAERGFVERLGQDARGRIRLRGHNDEFIEHLTFRDGRFFVEAGHPGRPLKAMLLTHMTREVRLLAADKLDELWRACGGPPRNSATLDVAEELSKTSA
jgi:hypothetical protein